MKKLNRKGFTLIELLAVIVILAIVMVVTIPSVLNSMEGARQKQFENAITIIQDYVQKNYDLCNFTEVDTGYDATIFSNTTTCTVDNSKVVAAAGYDTNDITITTASVTNGKYTITKATAGDNSQFKGASIGS